MEEYHRRSLFFEYLVLIHSNPRSVCCRKANVICIDAFGLHIIYRYLGGLGISTGGMSQILTHLAGGASDF